MRLKILLEILIVFLDYLLYSRAHSASSSSAFASSSLKFKNPKLDKDSNAPGRKNRPGMDEDVEEDEDGSK